MRRLATFTCKELLHAFSNIVILSIPQIIAGLDVVIDHVEPQCIAAVV